jgi:HAD superfamily hydrolase (TIGR01509 family)
MTAPELAAGPGSVPGAVLFDMDGLLVDTEPLWTVGERELAARYGKVFTPEIKTAMIGQGVDTAVPLMLTMLGVPAADAADASAFLLARVAELFGEPGRIVLFPGAAELLAELRALGVATALVSSSFRVLMDSVLAVVGRDAFTVTVAGDEVSLRKPAPEPYLRAAALLGVAPAACVVLEDSSSGAAAGLAAGCPTIMIPSEYGAVPPDGVTVRSSLRDVTVELLAGLVSAGDALAS